jgi:hypothetical protein
MRLGIANPKLTIRQFLVHSRGNRDAPSQRQTRIGIWFGCRFLARVENKGELPEQEKRKLTRNQHIGRSQDRYQKSVPIFSF